MKRRMNKRVSSSILLSCLILVVAIGGTLAYLSTKTQAKTNEFTFLGSNDISATLSEPKWEGHLNDDAGYGKNLTPGAILEKDPIITNTCGLDEYVATRVTFQKGDGTTMTQAQYDKLLTLIEIDWNTADWAIDGTAGPVAIYDYNTLLTGASAAPYNATNSLFTQVTIKQNLTNEEMNWLKDAGTATAIDGVEGIGGFNIYIEGAAIQGSEFADIDAAKADLNALFS